MFTNYTALAFLLPDGKSESSLQLAPNLKCCPRCSKNKQVAEFHSKGNGRYEKLCKICSNARKNERNQTKKKEKEKNNNKRRKETKTINTTDFKIIEREADHPIADVRHLEILLQDFVFDFSVEDEC